MNVSPVRQMVFLASNQKQHPSMFNLCSIQPHTLIVHRYVIFIWRGLLIDKRHSFWFYSNNINALNLPFILHSLYQSFFLATSKTISYKRAIKLKRKEIWNVKKILSDDFLWRKNIYGIVLEMVIRIKNKNTSNIPIPNHISDLQIL